MKLLAPRELNTKLQDQKKTEINAGLFLAKKVDRLREEVQEEQKNHDEAILRMEKEYQCLLEKLEIQKKKITDEIVSREAELIKLRLPLDAEWASVRNQKKQNDQTKEIIFSQAETLKTHEQELLKKESDLNFREERVKDNETRTDELLQKALDQYRESQDIKLKATQYETETTESIEIRTKAIKKRETDIAYREVDAENKWKNALSKEEANRKETLRIESKQRQLKIGLDLTKNVTHNNTNTKC